MSDTAARTASQTADDTAGAPRKPSLFMRDDTMLGVCAGLGEEFGVSPVWLRIGFAVMLLVSPVLVIATYLAIGVVLAAVRWLYPARRSVATPAPVAAPVATNDALDTITARAA